ncbi:MAG TPA: diaminopimelate decarboxylase, partial [Mycobacteriales bacterium]|nr:diaminopimelate decarboxylase [Mycobacteriales bacterium]
LHVGGVDVRDAVAEHGSPAYLCTEADFRARCREHRAAFGADTDIYYAGKAFLCRAVVRWVDEEGLSLDVATGGELAIALAAGFPAQRILVHGNNKSPAELTAAVEAGVGRIVIDSDMEIARLATVAEKAGVRQKVYVRVTVGVEAHTHEFIATAHEDQKFGFSLSSGAALEAVRRVLMLPSLELVGLHSHIGSQIFDTAGFEVAAHRVVGKHCEAGDIVVRDAWLPSDLAPGDLLAVAATGAYCRSMASNYNTVPRPPVIAVGDGQSRVLVRRESLDDLFALDIS